MSKLVKRKRKILSDTDSLILNCPDDEPATTGPVPYDDFFDCGPNGIHYIFDKLYYYDDNYFNPGPNEPISLFEVYKL